MFGCIPETFWVFFITQLTIMGVFESNQINHKSSLWWKSS